MEAIRDNDFFAKVTDWSSTAAKQGVYCLYGHHQQDWNFKYQKSTNSWCRPECVAELWHLP
eukprot:12882307-Prorocentrum_lima.AAC.1